MIDRRELQTTGEKILLQVLRRYIHEGDTVFSDSQRIVGELTREFSGVKRYRPGQKKIDYYVVKDLSSLGFILKQKPSNIACQISTNSHSIGGIYKDLHAKLSRAGYKAVYAEPHGRPITNSSLLGKITKLLPYSPLYSPHYILIYTNDSSVPLYRPAYRLSARIGRVFDRATISIRDHIFPRLLANPTIDHMVGWLEITMFRKRHKELISNYISKIDVSLDKRSVVIVQTWLEHGGVEKVMLNLIKGLEQKGYHIHLFTTVLSTNPWHSQFASHCSNIIHLPLLLGHRYRFYYAEYIAEYARHLQPKALLVTNSMPGYKACKAIQSVSPETVTIDILHTHGTPKEKDAYLRKSMPYIKYLNHRVVISEYLRDYYLSKYPIDPDTIKVIYNGMDEEQLNYKPNIKSGERAISKISGKRSITYIGRLDPDKSPFRLIAIAEKLSERSADNVVFYVCGPGIHSVEMHQRIKEKGLKNIKLIGPIGNPLDILAASDYSILTSDAEGIPLVVLESMKVGCVPIMPAVGGIPEMIEDRISGYLVDIRGLEEEAKIEAFTSTIIEALNKSSADHAAFGARGKDILNERFSRMVDDYTALIESS